MTLHSSVTETPETDSDRVSEARPITVSFKTDVQYHEYECSASAGVPIVVDWPSQMLTSLPAFAVGRGPSTVIVTESFA